MPRERPRTDPPRECQGCHHKLARAHFRYSHVYCNRCYAEIQGGADAVIAEKIGLHDEGMLGQLQQVLESTDPDMPQVMSKFLEIYGGHAEFARSIALTMARMEGRYQNGRILSHEEAHRGGYLVEVAKPAVFQQFLKMMIASMHDTDVFKRAGNPFDGVSIDDMEAQIAQVAWDRMGTDSRFDDLIINKVESDLQFQAKLLGRIKGNPALMQRLMEVAAVIPTTSEPARLTDES